MLPGDTFTMSSTAFARLATPIKPVMDNMYLDTHFFFVPYRLVWDNWQQFMGERPTPTSDPNDFELPYTSVNLNRESGDVADYFGIPRNMSAPSENMVFVSALPFRAYALIYDTWYRDQNLQLPGNIDLGDGPDPIGQVLLPRRRGKRHDYFTSCLPWPQKGDPVYIPLGSIAPVVSNGQVIQVQGVTDTVVRPLGLTVHETTNLMSYGTPAIASSQNARWGTSTGLMADLESATAVTINDLRTAFQVQRLLERDARGGTRYIELILSHFGVHSDDARLQRPEFLGGGTSMININPIAVTTSTNDSIQGDLTAFGTVVGKAGFSKSFTEHGIIIGLVSARADLTYQNGVERFWSRSTRYDFYWPALAHLGEQAVMVREIYATGKGDPSDITIDEFTFGYQERYAEYRYKPSRITGLFASSDPISLDFWHVAQDFDANPGLNSTFISEDPPIDRIVAVPGEPHFLLDMWFSLKCDRPMPVYSVPGMIDHF